MADHIDPVATLQRGARPSRRRHGEHDFVTPSLPTPAIARPTVWAASQQSGEEVLAGVETLEAGIGRKELARRVLGGRHLLTWLAGFPGETWQQRWLASDADTAGKAWTDLPNASGTPTCATNPDTRSIPGRCMPHRRPHGPLAVSDAVIVAAFHATAAKALSMAELRRALTDAGFGESGGRRLVRGSPILRRTAYGRYTLSGHDDSRPRGPACADP
jgi:hypothetical protein